MICSVTSPLDKLALPEAAPSPKKKRKKGKAAG
jgi:hypothetical protein